ncbi:zona pellucida sperm-binding protein 3-like [Scomber scombrus]|uniref:Zona pellucida sperm-binding protein 3 n=1 Tax=Scomber scombrus TaxID=13677 RepID=A0AAV1NSQ1_SCOSC
MGFREAVLLGFVLLFSGGNLCAASQNFSPNETLNQTPQEQATLLPSSQQITDHQSNRTGHSHPARSPVSYRLKIYQLRKPAVRPDIQKPLQPLAGQTFQNPQRSQAGALTPELLELRETQKLIKGPNLNPTVKHKSKVMVKFEQRMPVPADSVAARCGEGEVTIEVKQNFLGNGQLIRPSDVTLGGCVALDTADHILKFQTELQGCGSTMTMTEKALVYTFSLMYSPTPIGNTSIFKTNPAEVVIECHFQRRHYVSSDAMQPTWKPFASEMLAEQQLRFSLRLMTEDWQSQRPSSVYFLSDVMHIEASVHQGHHLPMRVFVESCVAHASPDPNSQPRYSFVNNHGCLTDAKMTGAKSYFMQRSREDKLHFQLKAFKFHQDHRNSLYITCHLKATTLSVPIDSHHKACSFLPEANRWVASGGDNKVCSCCETSCSERRLRRSLAADADLQWEGTAALGPILLEENILQNELTELSEFPPESSSLLHTLEVIQAASCPSVALLCGVGAALAVMLLFFMGGAIHSRLHKPTGYSVST